jgi:hypothetical protein
MLTTVEGIYENGQVIFKEKPTIQTKTKVYITFVEEITENSMIKKRPFGTLQGSIKLSADFNEPLDNLKEYM